MSLTPSVSPASGPDLALTTGIAGRSRKAFSLSRVASIVSIPDTVAAPLFDGAIIASGGARGAGPPEAWGGSVGQLAGAEIAPPLSCGLNDRKWAFVNDRFRSKTPGGSRTADMKALDFIYAEFAHKSHLFVGLHPFDQDFVAAISDQADNVLEHRLAPWGRRSHEETSDQSSPYRNRSDEAMKDPRNPSRSHQAIS